MRNSKITQAIRTAVENEIPATSVDLWPTIKDKISSRMQNRHSTGVNNMKKQPFSLLRSRAFTLTSVVIMLFTSFLVFTPQGRTLAQTIFQYFVHAESNQAVIPTLSVKLVSQPENPEAASVSGSDIKPGCGATLTSGCSIEMVQKIVSFKPLIPEFSIEEMTFSRAAADKNNSAMEFKTQKGTLLLLQTPIEMDDVSTWTIGKDAEIQSVTVNNQPAEFVLGGWVDNGLDVAGFQWNENQPTRTLRWDAGGVRMTLINLPEQSARGPIGFEIDELTQIAAKINTKDMQKLAEGTADGFAREQAEQKAGFRIVDVRWLPGGYEIGKIRYSSENNAFCQYFHTDPANINPSLVLAQSNWALPEIETLLAEVFYDGKAVELSRIERHLILKGADGGLGFFIETGMQSHRYCGGEPAYANRALLWQKDNQSFILFGQMNTNDGRGFLTLNEMAKVAESINGVDSMDTIPDLERMTSRKQAEEVTGVDILLPSKMIKGVKFSHISTDSVEQDWEMINTYYAGAPVGDGRTYHILITQTPNPENSLEEMRLAGGFSDITIRDQEAIYNPSCWQSNELSARTECRQELIWVEDGTMFSISAYFPALIPDEIFFSLAESMR